MEVCNIVAVCSLGRTLDLADLALNVRNAVYKPDILPAVCINLPSPECTCVVYATGTVIVTGCREEAHAKLAATKCRRIVSQYQKGCHLQDFVVQNVVARAHLGYRVVLEKLVADPLITYDPEIIGAAVVQQYAPVRATLMVFRSGFVVVTQCASVADAQDAVAEQTERIFALGGVPAARRVR